MKEPINDLSKSDLFLIGIVLIGVGAIGFILVFHIAGPK